MANNVFSLNKETGEFSLDFSRLNSIGIDSDEAKQLRAELLKRNIQLKQEKKTETEYPQVLIPHHAVRIYRHVKSYDQFGWFKANSETCFEVKPFGGYKDILGFSFKYSYDKPVTDFSIQFNNFRGQNRNIFMSGDVVEFYFELVDEATLKAIERFDGYNIASYRYNSLPPLVFTGRIESLDSGNSEEGVTIAWKGRSGGYILTDRKISENYPVRTEKVTGNSMLYEEIIYDFVTYKTGMVIGEIDLGQSKDKYISKARMLKDAQDLCTSDLMGYQLEMSGASEDKSGIKNSTYVQNAAGAVASNIPFEAGIKQEIENILKRYPFCSVTEELPFPNIDLYGFGAEQAQNTNMGEKNKVTRVRWSALLDYDLMVPAIFNIATVQAAGTDVAGQQAMGGGVSADGTVSNQLTGDYHFQSKRDPTTWFKTDWARAIFDEVTFPRKNMGKAQIEKFAKIRTMFQQKGVSSRMVNISEFVVNGNFDRDPILLQVYERIYGGKFGALQAISERTQHPEYIKFKDLLNKAYQDSGGKQDSSSFFGSESSQEADKPVACPPNILNFDLAAYPIQRELQNPKRDKFNANNWLVVPVLNNSEGAPEVQQYSIQQFVPIDGLASNATAIFGKIKKEQGENISLMRVNSTYAMQNGGAIKIEIRETKGIVAQAEKEAKNANRSAGVEVSYVNITLIVENVQDFYPDLNVVNPITNKPGLVMNNIINRTDVIAQTLSQNHFEVTLLADALKDLKQPVLPGTYILESPKPGKDGNMPEAQAVDLQFKAAGTVDKCLSDAMAKFFSCIAYVDEFNILHVRPRYKHLQKEGMRKASKYEIPPIWGLYSGQPVYPRLFKVTLADEMKNQPNSLVVFGDIPNSGNVFVKVDHRMLQTAYGIKQVMEKGETSFNNKYEGQNIATNKLLSYVRSGYTVSVECDIIPELRPGHRVNVVDFVTSAVGQFLIENISWEYKKEGGIKMSLGLSSLSLQSEDAFTSIAILVEGDSKSKFGDDYMQRIQERMTNSGMGTQGQIFDNIVRAINVETGKAAKLQELEKQQKSHEEWANKVLPEFELDRDGGVVVFKPRFGFEDDDNNQKR